MDERRLEVNSWFNKTGFNTERPSNDKERFRKKYFEVFKPLLIANAFLVFGDSSDKSSFKLFIRKALSKILLISSSVYIVITTLSSFIYYERCIM